MSGAQRLAEHHEILPLIDYSLDDIDDFEIRRPAKSCGYGPALKQCCRNCR